MIPLSFNFSRFAAIIRKEFIQMRRDRLTFAMMFGIPIIQLILFGFAINTDPKSLPEKYYTFADGCAVAGINCLVSQTGYTGENGYELYCKTGDAVALWNSLLLAGVDEGLIPCGLGARDTLRMEAAMPLYGHEMDDTVSPLETGLGFAVKLKKEDFIGKAALIATFD